MRNRYTKEMYKNEMLLLITKSGYDPVSIAKTTSRIFSLHLADIDLELYDKMLDIMTMEDGPEFEKTEEKFMEFINSL